MSPKQKELLVRTQTAVVFAAVMFSGIYFNVFSYLCLMCFIMLASINEFHNVMKPTRQANKVSRWYKPLSFLIAAAFFIVSYFIIEGSVDAKLLLAFPAIVFIFFILELFAESKHPFANISTNVLGLVYLTLPFVALNFVAIRENEGYEFKMVLAILFIIWANDVFAYLVGSRIGKHKMLPRISPGKSWEGIAGGVVGAAGVAVLLSYWFDLHYLFLTDWICMGVIISFAATVGDLSESMLKRSLHIKDSGTMLPGHGGILDRFDAFYFAVPFVALYLALMGKL